MKTTMVRIECRGGVEERAITTDQLVIAGWTGRDRAAMEHHMAELEAIGVKRPPRAPMFYRVAAARLTCDPAIEALGPDTSGEVEFVLLSHGSQLYVGVGSDHTDRKLETVGVSVSKQICEKPIAAAFWPMAEVEAHWEKLMLRSYIVASGERQLYQEGSVATMLAPRDLLKEYGESLAEGAMMFGGTLAAMGGIRPADRFEAELEDPVLNRRIAFGYDIRTLPDLG